MTDDDGNRLLTNELVNAIWRKNESHEFTVGHVADI